MSDPMMETKKPIWHRERLLRLGDCRPAFVPLLMRLNPPDVSNCIPFVFSSHLLPRLKTTISHIFGLPLYIQNHGHALHTRYTRLSGGRIGFPYGDAPGCYRYYHPNRLRSASRMHACLLGQLRYCCSSFIIYSSDKETCSEGT